jgi:hypothetical protein
MLANPETDLELATCSKLRQQLIVLNRQVKRPPMGGFFDLAKHIYNSLIVQYDTQRWLDVYEVIPNRKMKLAIHAGQSL